MEIADTPEQQTARTKLKQTYVVTILMLLFGQVQVVAIMEIESLKRFLTKHYYVSLMNFFVSFISIQLYVFFYSMLERKSKWIRLFVGIWTYEVNTISIMKPAKTAPFISLVVSWALTFVVMAISFIYGNCAVAHQRGLFVSRHNVIRWSERMYVLTCFGIIVCAEMKHISIEFPALFIYTVMSNIFVIVFAASIRKPKFYQSEDIADHILIGQLYYLNIFALYMSYVWTTAAGIDLIKTHLSFR
ncbi:uncharacterized protein LOC115483364 isoform X2 [Drosophila hydei]|uniref:Uncharacterized protein LOC111599292 isoform X2 n=1 Tax=Drosophila hydei TaxID=7224 RepID=A0A6J1LYG1_DROHY|nr:uncharacterized protein LOC111599292 isoform X2 [Drosophila hydei]XP_030080912.1 uncharacterized protein LOC115483364 isoform X2 [Drosophila hydei]